MSRSDARLERVLIRHPQQAKRPLLGQADRLNAIGNEPWSVGEWWCTLQGQNGPVLVSSYWSAIYVRERDDWKFQMLNYNVPPTRWHPFIDNRSKQLALLSLSLPNRPCPYSGWWLEETKPLASSHQPLDTIRTRFGGSVKSPKPKRVSDVKIGVLIVDQIEPAILKGTDVRLDLSKGQGIK